MKRKLIVFTGPSGSGKSTFVKHALATYPTLRLSVSATTRKKRGNEVDGVDYIFMESINDFKKKISEGNFIEWEEVYKDIFYGTPKEQLEVMHANNQIPLFDVDTKGAFTLKNLDGYETISFFIKPPHPEIDIIEKRIRTRAEKNGDTIADVEVLKRKGKAFEELAVMHNFDHIIVNDNLELALVEVCKILDIFFSE